MPSRYDHYATHHTSRRLDGWDYTQSAVYFVTVCTHNRECLFGAVDDGSMALNAFGRIVAEEWHRTGEKRDRVALDAFVVMPNHVHGILWIRPDPANLRQAAPRDDDGSVDRGDAARGGGATDDDGGVGRGDRARGCGAPDDDGGVGRGDAARGGGAMDDDGRVDRGDAARGGGAMDDDGGVERGDAARGGGAPDDDGGVGRGDRARGYGAPDDDGSIERGDAARGGGAPDDDGGVERGDAARGGGTMDDDGSIERSVTARRDASMASADGDDASSTSPHREFGQPRAGSLGTVVGAFKSAVTRRINQHRDTPGASVWQRNYHDRIIRNEHHLHAARRYIRDNPAKWHEDRAHRGG